MLFSCPFNLDRSANRVLWEITKKCNMNCKHCLYYSQNDELIKDDLSLSSAYRIIQQMQKDGTIDEVWLSGGEPLMRNDILNIIDTISKCGMKPSISTNGYLVDAPLAEKLKMSGIRYVHLSIDGVDEASHDEFRQKAGAFKHVLNAAKFLSDVNITVGATCVITWSNISEMRQMVQLALDNNIRVLSFYMVEPLGRGRDFNSTLDKNLMVKLSCAFEQIKHDFQNDIHLELFRSSSLKEPLQNCKCYNFLTITHDGKLGGCPWLMKSTNNPCKLDLSNYTFAQARIIAQNELKNYTVKRIKSLLKCNDCFFNESCGKGCPAVSDKDLIDPLCHFLREENE